MSSLRLLNETIANSVSSVSIKDVFTTDFDVYKFTTYQEGFSGNTSIEGRLINSSGSIITASNYDYARHLLKASSSFYEQGVSNNSDFRSFGEADDDGCASVSYIFNPMNSSTYTFLLSQDVSSNDAYSMKCIAILKQTTKVGGLHFFTDNGGTMTKFECRVYGLRIDSWWQID